MKTGILTTDTYLNHNTGQGHPERADRVTVVIDHLKKTKSKMNACGYSLGTTFAPNWMDWPMLHTGNPVILRPGMVFFMHMILMDSDNQLAMNLGETYLVTKNGNERLGKKKLDLVIG